MWEDEVNVGVVWYYTWFSGTLCVWGGGGVYVV